MKFYCKILNKAFDDQKEMFRALVDNQEDIINIKKSAIKNSDPIGLQIKRDIPNEVIKALQPNKRLDYGDYVHPVINTTKYLDSHQDVHIDGIWDKSLKEQQGKTYLIVNHELEVGKVITWPKDVTPMVQDIKWKDLGADYTGETQALIFKSKLTTRTNKDAFEAYAEGDPVQHSVRMQYVKMRMAINNKDYKEEFEAWQTYYPMIANKEDADKEGFFFAILEAKIFKEGSMVLAGSNDITPTLYDFEPPNKALNTTEPQEGSTLDWDYLIKNLKL